MNPPAPHTIYSLGDSAVTIDFGNIIDEEVNKQVQQFFNDLREQPLPGMIEALPAYSSLTIYYEADKPDHHGFGTTAYASFRKAIEERLKKFTGIASKEPGLVRIPACYDHEYGSDLQAVAAAKKIEPGEVIRLHESGLYRVYMIGFLPGFPYMGILDKQIAMPRKEKPATVRSGSIGIAGMQTGIYPVDSPGGWQIIGRTPLKLFDKQKEQPALLKPGDRVQFYSITKDEFENYPDRNP